MKPHFQKGHFPRVISVKLLAFGVGLALTLSGCSAFSRKTDSEENTAAAPTETPAAPSATDGKSPKELAEIKELLNQMHGRLDRMESKLDTKKEPVTEIVSPHSSQSTGKLPRASLSNTDPEKGFVQDPPVQEYRKALVYFSGGKWTDSILGFAAFLERFPDHPMAGTAQFFIGESYYQLKQFKEALKEYDRVLTSYDRSSHVSHALARIVEVEEKLHMKTDASKHRQILSALFPQSPATAWVGSSSRAAQESEAPRVIPKMDTDETTDQGIHEKAPGDASLDAPPAITAPVQVEDTTE